MLSFFSPNRPSRRNSATSLFSLASLDNIVKACANPFKFSTGPKIEVQSAFGANPKGPQQYCEPPEYAAFDFEDKFECFLDSPDETEDISQIRHEFYYRNNGETETEAHYEPQPEPLIVPQDDMTGDLFQQMRDYLQGPSPSGFGTVFTSSEESIQEFHAGFDETKAFVRTSSIPEDNQTPKGPAIEELRAYLNGPRPLGYNNQIYPAEFGIEEFRYHYGRAKERAAGSPIYDEPEQKANSRSFNQVGRILSKCLKLRL